MKIAMIGCRPMPEIYSGIDLMFKEMGPRLVRRGHRVVAYCRKGYPCFNDEYEGVKLFKTDCIQRKRFEALSYSANATIAAAREKFDIVHFHTQASGIFAFLPMVRRQATVLTIHSLNWQHSKWNAVDKAAIRLVERFALGFADAVVAVSRTQQEYLSNRYRRMIYLIGNGVSLMPKIPAKRIYEFGLTPGKYILYVGRLSREKGCHTLLEAFKTMDGGMQLAIAGDRQTNAEYARNLQKYANGNVRFLGRVAPDVLAELYSNGMMFVLPSESEGMSISLLEAMSHGSCVVASSIPPNTEVLGDCGLTFPVGNAAALRQQMKLLIDNSALRQELGERGRERVAKLNDWDMICSQYEKIYASLL
jgi:glycosyltransferase involved in cell wall biosynthesis